MEFRAGLESGGKTATAALPPGQQKELVRGVRSAKKPETRQRRVLAAIETLRSRGTSS